MKGRSFVLAVLMSAAMTVGGAGAASANIAWCTADPPVHVDTESGANVTVSTSVTVPRAEAGYLKDVTSDAVVTANGTGGTNIAVSVYLPATISTAIVVAEVKRYHVSSTATGVGGSTVMLYLTVPVA
jgi:hypothetical protein